MKISNIKFYVIAGFLALTACEGDEDPFNPDGGGFEAKLGQLYVDAEARASNIYNRIDEARRDSVLEASDSTVIDGATVTRTGSDIKINFGNGVTGSDGKVRKGSIDVSESGDYLVPGGSLTATLNNYSVDDEPITGSLMAQNDGNDSISVTVTNLNYKNEFNFQSSKTIYWESGFSTINDVSDDRYQVGGSGTGTETAGNNQVVATFVDPMILDKTCEHSILEGVIDLTLSGDSVNYDGVGVNFIAGDGVNSDGCDNLFRIAVDQNGTNVTFTRQFSGF